MLPRIANWLIIKSSEKTIAIKQDDTESKRYELILNDFRKTRKSS